MSLDLNFCSAPDTGLHVGTGGAVKLCCAGNYDLGNIRKQSIIEIFSGPFYKEMRKNPAYYCKGCTDLYKISPTTGLRNMFTAYPSIGERKIKVLDVRWNNVCNLSCRYCNPRDSSEWAKLMHIPIETVNRDYNESLFENIIENKDNIECVMLLGGEPLMQKHNERLLSIINPNTKIDIITNLSIPNLVNNKIYQSLKKFSNITWSISMDNVRERAEYVRHGTKWETLVQNIDTVISDFGHLKIGLMPIYHIWSALHLKELYEFAHSKQLRINWQMGLDTHGTNHDTDSFLVSGHNQTIINRAITEIDSLGLDSEFYNPLFHDSSFLAGVREMLVSNVVDPSKGTKLRNWITDSENLMPPAKPFTEVFAELNTLL